LCSRLLLFDRQGEHQNFSDQSKDDQGKNVVVEDKVQCLHDQAQGVTEKVSDKTHFFTLQNCVCYFFVFGGTGSYPPLQKGLQRSMRHIAIRLPLKAPCTLIASMA